MFQRLLIWSLLIFSGFGEGQQMSQIFHFDPIVTLCLYKKWLRKYSLQWKCKIISNTLCLRLRKCNIKRKLDMKSIFQQKFTLHNETKDAKDVEIMK